MKGTEESGQKNPYIFIPTAGKHCPAALGARTRKERQHVRNAVWPVLPTCCGPQLMRCGGPVWIRSSGTAGSLHESSGFVFIAWNNRSSGTLEFTFAPPLITGQGFSAGFLTRKYHCCCCLNKNIQQVCINSEAYIGVLTF